MNEKNLLAPILEGGVRNTHFFQGRLLTAEDLRAEQNANRVRHRLLGQAVGPGVIEGLEVKRQDPTGTAPILTIRPGHAINGGGQVLTLTEETQVTLTQPQETASVAPDAGLFVDCQPPVSDTLAVNSGVFLLVMSPASGFSEKAPKTGLASNGKSAAECDSRWAVEGVQFRLQQFPLAEITNISSATLEQLQELTEASELSQLSLLRNLLAHLCFGTEQAARFVNDPFAPNSSEVSTALSDLQQNGHLKACDVPLTLLFWAPPQGIAFLDPWSVRRRPTAGAPDSRWPALDLVRRGAIGEAVLLQFLDHVEDLLRATPDPANVLVREYFRFLPPAGFFPVESGNATGLFDARFFHDYPYRESIFLEAPRFDALIRQSLAFPPLDLADEESVWLYRVIGSGAGSGAFRVFARSSMAFEGSVSERTQVVPNFFGKFLADVRKLLDDDSFDLHLGSVLDIYGNELEAEGTTVQGRVVLSQIPQPRELVAAGSSVQIAVTADEATVEDPLPLEPRIVSYSPTPAVEVGQTLTIFGANFEPNPNDNLVIFDGQYHENPVQGTTSALYVVVPGLSPPLAAGEVRQIPVSVQRLVEGGTAVGPVLTVLPLPAPPPIISGFGQTQPVREGDDLTIDGSNFATNRTSNTIYFGSIAVIPQSGSTVQLSVRIPNLGSSSSTPQTVPIKVVVGGRHSSPVNLSVLGAVIAPPPPVPAPQIFSFSPSQIREGQNVQILGTNFHPDPAENRVVFKGPGGNVTRIPLDGGRTSLLVRVPGVTTVLRGYQPIPTSVKANGKESANRTLQVKPLVEVPLPPPPPPPDIPEEPTPPPGGHPF